MKHQPKRATNEALRRLVTMAAAISLVGLVVDQAYRPIVMTAQAFPSGAPESSCKDLKPIHGVEAQSAAGSPYELTQDKLQVGAGDQIKVTLSSPSKAAFKGLMVQALNERGEPRGRFLPGKGLKMLDTCSAVSHADKEPKRTATLVWEAPADLKAREAFTFKATVVAEYDQFYMNIKSTLGSAST